MSRLRMVIGPLSGLAMVTTLLWGAGPAGASGGWSVVPSPNAGDSHNSLSAVRAISAADVWAVGTFTSGTGGTQQTLTERCC